MKKSNAAHMSCGKHVCATVLKEAPRRIGWRRNKSFQKVARTYEDFSNTDELVLTPMRFSRRHGMRFRLKKTLSAVKLDSEAAQTINIEGIAVQIPEGEVVEVVEGEK